MKRQLSFKDILNDLSSGNFYGIFIDDTGSPGITNIPKYYKKGRKTWAAVIVRPEYMHEVLEQFPLALEELKKWFPKAKEFHFTDIWSGTKEFKEIEMNKRLALFNFMASIFDEYNFEILIQSLTNSELDQLMKLKPFKEDYVSVFNLKNEEDTALLFLLIRLLNT